MVDILVEIGGHGHQTIGRALCREHLLLMPQFIGASVDSFWRIIVTWLLIPIVEIPNNFHPHFLPVFLIFFFLPLILVYDLIVIFVFVFIVLLLAVGSRFIFWTLPIAKCQSRSRFTAVVAKFLLL